VLNENRWRALRDGLDGELVDPVTGCSEPTSDRLGRLLDELEPYARQLECSQQLAQARTLIVDGGGAGRQRAIVRRRGVGGLLAWLADTTEAVPPTLQTDAHPATAPALRLDPAPRSNTNIGQLDRAASLRGVGSVAQ
jgi:carboxylate-amine ligase